jgi:phosphonate transport system ATP-binding protein
VIQFQEVTKTFGSRTAVDKVSFNIDRPQMVGMIGRSGAGKSTLLRMINRLTPATSGKILFEGTRHPEPQGRHDAPLAA